jgi:hypothetical protein
VVVVIMVVVPPALLILAVSTPAQQQQQQQQQQQVFACTKLGFDSKQAAWQTSYCLLTTGPSADSAACID